MAASMLLDQAAHDLLPEEARSPHLLQWLLRLEAAATPERKGQLKEQQEELFAQLLRHGGTSPSPPVRARAASCIVALLNVCGTLKLATTVNALVDCLRAKDDGVSAQLVQKRAAAAILGVVCRRLGRTVSLHAQGIVGALTRAARSGDVLLRQCVFAALAGTVHGMGQSIGPFAKDITKCMRTGLGDREESIRLEAARCAQELAAAVTHLQTNELESTFTAGLRGLDGASYNTRYTITNMLGGLLSSSQNPDIWHGVKASKVVSLDDVLGLLMSAFVKGGSRHTRVGVTQAFVAFFAHQGATWVENNVKVVLKCMLGLFVPKALSSPMEALYTRKCVAYVLVTVLGRRMGEKGRLDAVRSLSSVVKQHMEELAKEGGPSDKSDRTHNLTCALDTMAELVTIIGSPTLALLSTIEAPLFACSLHPSRGTRLAAANCLRCISMEVPSKACSIASTGMRRIVELKASPDALHGSALAVAAVLGASASSTLGLPQALTAKVYACGRDLVKAAPKAAQGSFAAGLSSLESGWALLGALVSMGPPAAGSYVPELMSMWGGVLSSDANPPKGKTSTPEAWRLLLQSRLGAVVCIQSLLTDCKSLVTDEVQKQVAGLLCCALEALDTLPKQSKVAQRVYNTKLHFRCHLMEAFAQMPLRLYEESLPKLLPHLVADFTLTESSNLITTTSLLRAQCHEEDGVLMGAYLHDTDAKAVEDQLEQHGGSGLGALENRPSAVFQSTPLQPHEMLPVEVMAVDAAVTLFGRLFPFITSQKHRAQLLDHFLTCIKAAKAGPRRQAIQINIFTAFLAALKGIGDVKGTLGKAKVVQPGRDLVVAALTNQDCTLRCAAGEAVGRMGQVVGGQFTVETITSFVDRLQKDPNVVSRTGHSLGIGCIHRYVGGMDASRHLQATVGILQALARDGNPLVQTWALHGLMLTIDSAGFDFHPYTEAALTLVTCLIHSEAESSVHQCAGNVLNAVVTTLGPELQANDKQRERIIVLLEQLQQHPDPSVCLTGFRCMQQLILFTPQQVDVPAFVPRLQQTLESPHLLLRRASISILRQLVQRRPRVIHQHGDEIEALLFSMLDSQEDPKMLFDLREAILALLLALAAEAPSFWLLLCNKVLSGASQKEQAGQQQDGGAEEEQDEDGVGMFITTAAAARTVLPTRWQTKVFAVGCVRRVIEECSAASTPERPHLDLGLARQVGGDFLVLRLGELVRTAFLAATSTIDQLRQAGLEALQDVVQRFASTLDADMDGRVPLLEQYMAQVTSAMLPAFDEETPPHVTTTACHVCAEWICSGVCNTARDLRRVTSLLARRLESISSPADPAFNERATTMLRLAILSSWARILISSHVDAAEKPYLAELVGPVQPQLVENWLSALRDYALVSLPPEYGSQVPKSGSFYSDGTRESVLPFYSKAFPTLIRAVALSADLSDEGDPSHFYLVLGLASRALCGRTATEKAVACLQAVQRVVSSSHRLVNDPALMMELCGVLSCAMRTQGGPVTMHVLEAIGSMVAGNGAITDNNAPMEPGRSPIYAVLELCVSTLLRLLPQLAPGGSRDGAGRTLGDDEVHAVGKATSLLGDICALCGSASRASVLPAVLTLLFGALKELPLAATGATLISLKGVVSSCTTDEEENVLLSLAMAALEEAKTAADPSPFLRCVALVVASKPACANHPEIRGALIAAVQAALAPAMPAPTRGQALQVATALFLRCDAGVVGPYVRAWGSLPLDGLATAARKPPKDAEELAYLQACIRAMEALLQITPDTHREALLAACLPILVALLATGAAPAVGGSPVAGLQQAALAAVLKVGPAYPQAFRTVVGLAPQLKQRLEAAIKAGKGGGSGAGAAAQRSASAAPKIQLKMDFSNFSA